MARCDLVDTDEILKQNLAIEPDLQNFMNFALQSVGKLGGNAFVASVALLKLLEKLRLAGAASGRPMPVSLLLQDRKVIAQWGMEQALIVNLAHSPHPEWVVELRGLLKGSVALMDPEILMRRSLEMERHFDELRRKAEEELEVLQQTLKLRQNELMETILLAETDALTGLLNRRAFDARLKQTFQHIMRQKDSPLSLLFFDLDHFKDVNDKFGHQAGDRHLRQMADVLRKMIRENVDFAFRFGGDEFAVVFFADHCQACDKAKQVLMMMDNQVSAGITSINQNTPDDLSLEEFIRRADNALYEAKRSGRGRVIVDTCFSQMKADCVYPCPEITGGLRVVGRC